MSADNTQDTEQIYLSDSEFIESNPKPIVIHNPLAAYNNDDDDEEKVPSKYSESFPPNFKLESANFQERYLKIIRVLLDQNTIIKGIIGEAQIPEGHLVEAARKAYEKWQRKFDLVKPHTKRKQSKIPSAPKTKPGKFKNITELVQAFMKKSGKIGKFKSKWILTTWRMLFVNLLPASRQTTKLGNLTNEEFEQKHQEYLASVNGEEFAANFSPLSEMVKCEQISLLMEYLTKIAGRYILVKKTDKSIYSMSLLSKNGDWFREIKAKDFSELLQSFPGCSGTPPKMMKILTTCYSTIIDFLKIGSKMSKIRNIFGSFEEGFSEMIQKEGESGVYCDHFRLNDCKSFLKKRNSAYRDDLLVDVKDKCQQNEEKRLEYLGMYQGIEANIFHGWRNYIISESEPVHDKKWLKSFQEKSLVIGQEFLKNNNSSDRTKEKIADLVNLGEPVPFHLTENLVDGVQGTAIMTSWTKEYAENYFRGVMNIRKRMNRVNSIPPLVGGAPDTNNRPEDTVIPVPNIGSTNTTESIGHTQSQHPLSMDQQQQRQQLIDSAPSTWRSINNMMGNMDMNAEAATPPNMQISVRQAETPRAKNRSHEDLSKLL